MDNNNFSKNRSLNETISHQQTLILIGLAGLAAIVLAVIPWLEPLNYSFRLLITLVHELGHGLAALLTGGTFIRFVVFSDGSGLAYTAGGWRFLVIPAGYLGVALFGAILIMLGRNHRWSRIAMVVIGLVMVLFSLRYGTPSIFTDQLLSGVLTTVSGVFFGGLFLLVAFKASDRWIVFLLHFIAIQAGLTAFSDIVTVIGLSVPSLTPARSDAQSMADLTYIPAIVWAVLWAIIATVFIVSAVWFTWLRPSRIQVRATDKSPRRLPL
ncbi:MAG: M50 family metallopeptidase [Anaerolineae bacterium]|nr:M50 family metallopeptidase [Anaerolineae bacterium]